MLMIYMTGYPDKSIDSLRNMLFSFCALEKLKIGDFFAAGLEFFGDFSVPIAVETLTLHYLTPPNTISR